MTIEFDNELLNHQGNLLMILENEVFPSVKISQYYN